MNIAKTSAWLMIGVTSILSAASSIAAQTVPLGNMNAETSDVRPGANRTARPAADPQVKCAGGQLTIMANGSTMASIFAAIHSCLGLDIIVPNGAETSRTYAALGPGPTRIVIEDLLASSDYDYVLRASNTEPDKIQSVMLMARTLDASAGSRAQVPEGLAVTPARAIWLESLKASRHGGEEVPASLETPEPEGSAAEDSGTPIKQQGGNPLPHSSSVSAKPAAPDAEQPSSQSVPARETAVPASDDSTAADGDAAPAPSKEVQDKISNMEQLFAQRKQMMESQSQAAKPQ